jgi:hypothetical protein
MGLFWHHNTCTLHFTKRSSVLGNLLNGAFLGISVRCVDHEVVDGGGLDLDVVWDHARSIVVVHYPEQVVVVGC